MWIEIFLLVYNLIASIIQFLGCVSTNNNLRQTLEKIVNPAPSRLDTRTPTPNPDYKQINR